MAPVYGIKLLRSEVERSMNLLVFGEPPSHLPESNLANHVSNLEGTLSPDDGIVSYCENKAIEDGRFFKAIFGIKMVELAIPIVYGLSTNYSRLRGGDSYGYALVRCGLPLDVNGQYDKTASPYISLVLDDIAPLHCLKNENTCEALKTFDEVTKEERMKLKAEILADLDVNFISENNSSEPDAFTPYRTFQEPAIRFKTDHNRKVLAFEDPALSTENEDPDNLVDMSFMATKNSNQKIYMTAFARADKRLVRKNIDGLTLNGVYFNAKIGNTVRFVVDASGSMRECMITTNGVCKKTRMASVKNELVQILTDLKNIAPYTKVGISFFSHREGRNHMVWTYGEGDSGNENQLVVIGREGALADAEMLIESIQPQGWTEPWDGMDNAFADPETTTVFLLSDGEPKFNVSNQSQPEDRRSVYPELFAAWDVSGNQCKTQWWKNDDPNNYSTRWPRRWWGEKCWTTTQTSYNDWDRIASHYINKNKERSGNQKMNVHTVTIDLESNWMEKLSSETGGKHNQVSASDLN